MIAFRHGFIKLCNLSGTPMIDRLVLEPVMHDAQDLVMWLIVATRRLVRRRMPRPSGRPKVHPGKGGRRIKMKHECASQGIVNKG